MASGKMFCDDTPPPVLDRTRRRTRIARLWCYAVDDRPWQGPSPPAVIYRYAEDRRGRHIDEHLDGFRGVLQVHAYAGYVDLAGPGWPGGAITLAYCLAQARRGFFEQTKDPIAAEALRRISEIYAIEADIRGRLAEQRVVVRQAETRPLMASLWSWLMERLETISDPGQIHHGLMLLILLYCSIRSDNPCSDHPARSGDGGVSAHCLSRLPARASEIRDYWSRSASRKTTDTPDPT